MGIRAKMMGLAALTALVAACGEHPGSTEAPSAVSKPRAASPAPAQQQPTTPASADPAQAAARELLAKATATFENSPAYTTKMDFYQKMGSKTVSGRYDIAGKSPRTMRIVVEKGTGEGTKILWKGGATATVRPTGLLSAITVDLAQDDERLKSIRGYTLEQTDIKALFDELSDPANTVAGPQQTSDGLVVHCTGPHLLSGVASVDGVFDPQTLLPRKIQMFDSKEVVLRFAISNMQLKSSVSLSI